MIEARGWRFGAMFFDCRARFVLIVVKVGQPGDEWRGWTRSFRTRWLSNLIWRWKQWTR